MTFRVACERCPLTVAIVFAVSCLLAASACMAEDGGAAAVDAARLGNADAEPGQWMTYGRTYEEQRYSPLTSVNEATVGQLGLAWYADLDSNHGQESTPLVIDGVMYLTSLWSRVRALDARTGRLLWSYDPKVPGEWGAKACCGTDNRGAAAWNGKIYAGTVDGRLVALDAASGAVVWERVTVDQSKAYTITGAPRVVKGKVLIGNGGAEYGVRGYVSAYDAETGELAWRFYTVPGDPRLGFENPAMEMAARTWGADWWRLGGGGTAWDSIVYDPKTDLVFIGVGNGSPWPADLRSAGGGDHLFLSSIVAVDPDDGSYVWHYQTTPNESWDYTATQPIMIADLVIDGALRHVVMQAPKNGFFYVLDAATGKLISADNYVPVSWASGVDMATGRPVERPGARYEQAGTPVWQTPGPAGGHNWHPMAYSPQTGLVYVPTILATWAYALVEPFEISPIATNRGTDVALAQRMLQDPGIPRELAHDRDSELLAWDPVARKAVWRAPYAHRGPRSGGVLATAGGLVFHSTGDEELVAYRAADGERLWSFKTGTGVVAPPITYEIDGEQYLAVAAGRSTGGYYAPNTARLLVFKLGGTVELPPAPDYQAPPFDPPEQTASMEVIAHGEAVYFRNCSVCHGVDGEERGGLFPDLRRSAALRSAGSFRAIVLDGVLSPNGMASFASALGPDDAEAARAYLIEAARAAARDEAGGEVGQPR